MIWWQRYAVYLVVLMGLWGHGYYYGHHRASEAWQKKWTERDINEAVALTRERTAHEAALAAAKEAHAQEIADIAANLHPLPSVVCHATQSIPVRPPAVSGGGSPPAAVVPADTGVHPDISGALVLLARRADRLAADARQLNAVTH